MKASAIFTQINRDRYDLLKRYVGDLLLTILMTFFFYQYSPLNEFSSISTSLFFLPLAIIFGLTLSSLLHNSSHDNIKSNLLNRVVGIFCGAWVLYGHVNFVMIHSLHHKYSDKEFDPVNPKGMTFLVFVSAPMRYMIQTAKKYLFHIHGKNKDYETIMLTQTIVFHLNLIAKLAMWYALFGKTLFFSFYLVSLLTNYMIFAHINYACHRDNADGSIEVVNLDHNLYYKVANFFTMGGYYHKSHHINLSIFNPKKYNNKRLLRPLITVEGNSNTFEEFKMNNSTNKVLSYFDLAGIWGHKKEI